MTSSKPTESEIAEAAVKYLAATLYFVRHNRLPALYGLGPKTVETEELDLARIARENIDGDYNEDV